ncbi:hypothetical protein DES53_108242 [Roseimicrobium gellanilyticum]|uniref:Uncharacterized protein n=1 Tax=Roseimicrobium gellanilyticum TaxID=748857 RepID=A0A366HFE2_9BACT|nr:hypothetical protein DES53_108242 [Roseimicrobium gellanilyticum]
MALGWIPRRRQLDRRATSSVKTHYAYPGNLINIDIVAL